MLHHLTETTLVRRFLGAGGSRMSNLEVPPPAPTLPTPVSGCSLPPSLGSPLTQDSSIVLRGGQTQRKELVLREDTIVKLMCQLG